MNNLKVWLKGARLYTLPIGIVPVVMAISIFARYLFSGQIVVKPYNIENFVIQSLLCIGVAASMQISVNYANDYCDGLRGLDDQRSKRDVAKHYVMCLGDLLMLVLSQNQFCMLFAYLP